MNAGKKKINSCISISCVFENLINSNLVYFQFEFEKLVAMMQSGVAFEQICSCSGVDKERDVVSSPLQ